MKKIILGSLVFIALLFCVAFVVRFTMPTELHMPPHAAVASAAAPISTPDPIVGVDPDAPAMVQKAKALVAELEKHHVLARWNCVGNEAYVREIVWDQFDIDAKRGIARSLAVCCHAQKSGRYMTVKGFMSGRALAKFENDTLTVE